MLDTNIDIASFYFKHVKSKGWGKFLGGGKGGVAFNRRRSIRSRGAAPITDPTYYPLQPWNNVAYGDEMN